MTKIRKEKFTEQPTDSPNDPIKKDKERWESEKKKPETKEKTEKKKEDKK